MATPTTKIDVATKIRIWLSVAGLGFIIAVTSGVWLVKIGGAEEQIRNLRVEVAEVKEVQKKQVDILIEQSVIKQRTGRIEEDVKDLKRQVETTDSKIDEILRRLPRPGDTR